jgi:hypothetical protein
MIGFGMAHRNADCGLGIADWILDFGFWIADYGFRIADCGRRLWVARHRPSECGLRAHEAEIRNPHS